MIKLHSQTLRTFFHSLATTVAVAVTLAMTGHKTLGAGFAIGAVVSLMSLFSLKICVPALFYKGATSRSTALLQVVMMMKLPFYAICLYFATRLGSAAAFAAFVGCAIVPAVITAETAIRALIDANPAWKRAVAMRAPIEVLPEAAKSSAHAPDTKSPVSDAPSRVKVSTVL